MSGFRPFHTISARTFPPVSLIFVRRLSQGSQLVSSNVEGCLCCTRERDLEEEATAFDCGVVFDEDEKDPGPTITVTISYALSPVATSTREVLSISVAVNLSSILVGNIGNICEGVYRRAKLYIRESSKGWQAYDFQVGHCLCVRVLCEI